MKSMHPAGWLDESKLSLVKIEKPEPVEVKPDFCKGDWLPSETDYSAPITHGDLLDSFQEALAKPLAAPVDGWIAVPQHGECPVGEDVRVDIRFGTTGELFNTPAGNWLWAGCGVEECIISHYRIASAA